MLPPSTAWAFQLSLDGAKRGSFARFPSCIRAHLSPSCHPCHPRKRVQMPCTSMFCQPVTLFLRKILYTKQYLQAILQNSHLLQFVRNSAINKVVDCRSRRGNKSSHAGVQFRPGSCPPCCIPHYPYSLCIPKNP